MKRFDFDSQVAVMCGISGSGKSFQARKLEHQGYVRLSSDSIIWEKAGNKLSVLSIEEKKHIFEDCRHEMRRQLSDLLKSGKKVVVDATHCRRSSRDDVRSLCASHGVKPVFLYCEADKEELLRRLSQRMGQGADDLIVSREELEAYWQGFERPQPDESDFIFLNHFL